MALDTLLACLSVNLGVICLYQSYRRYKTIGAANRLRSVGVWTTGTVAEVKKLGWSEEPARFCVEFMAGGVIRFWVAGEQELGASVQVLYNPSEPNEHSYGEPAAPDWAGLMGALTGGLAALCFGFFWLYAGYPPLLPPFAD